MFDVNGGGEDRHGRVDVPPAAQYRSRRRQTRRRDRRAYEGAFRCASAARRATPRRGQRAARSDVARDLFRVYDLDGDGSTAYARGVGGADFAVFDALDADRRDMPDHPRRWRLGSVPRSSTFRGCVMEEQPRTADEGTRDERRAPPARGPIAGSTRQDWEKRSPKRAGD